MLRAAIEAREDGRTLHPTNPTWNSSAIPARDFPRTLEFHPLFLASVYQFLGPVLTIVVHDSDHLAFSSHRREVIDQVRQAFDFAEGRDYLG